MLNVCVLCTVNSTTIVYNAALGRPAYMSSVLHDFCGVFSASLANDGNLETNAIKNNKSTCANSITENYPWWAVDLGRAITVHRVDLTSRGNCCGMKTYKSLSNRDRFIEKELWERRVRGAQGEGRGGGRKGCPLPTEAVPLPEKNSILCLRPK